MQAWKPFNENSLERVFSGHLWDHKGNCKELKNEQERFNQQQWLFFQKIERERKRREGSSMNKRQECIVVKHKSLGPGWVLSPALLFTSYVNTGKLFNLSVEEQVRGVHSIKASNEA